MAELTTEAKALEALSPADPALDLEPRDEPPKAAYIICSSPRTGSTLLGRLLGGTGLAGRPAEYLHPLHLVPLAQRLGVPIQNGRLNIMQYMRALTRIRTSANGVFGLKAHFSQFAPLLHQGAWRHILPDEHVFICIERQDEIGQAISLAIARQTDCYTSAAQSDRAPVYDRHLVDDSLRMIGSDKQGWRAFFQQTGIDPFGTTYEELIAAPADVCGAICERLGIDGDPSHFELARTGMKKQASQVNTQWRERYQNGE